MASFKRGGIWWYKFYFARDPRVFEVDFKNCCKGG
jgi:hypothetical protein